MLPPPAIEFAKLVCITFWATYEGNLNIQKEPWLTPHGIDVE